MTAGSDTTTSADLRAAALAGVVAAAAYAAAMEADLRLTGHRTDDLKLIGRPLVRNPTRAKPIGALIHALNGAILGVLYARSVRHRLPGPPWLRGVVFASIENAALYPLLRFEHLHPGIRDAQLDRYWHRTAFLQSIPRHLAYGAVLGALYERLRGK